MLVLYFPILVFLLAGFVLGGTLLIVGHLVNRSIPDTKKNSPYECGFSPFDDARKPFDVRFYLVAILFIIFDLETAFLFPWAMVFKRLPEAGIISMAIFLCLLVIGFVYEWLKGALEWE
jgi:NADH-quinone oxidoreductase subunit A